MELWDIYDNGRNLTGHTHIRGKPMKDGDNHIVVGIILFNSSGQILITKRSFEKKGDPGKWENTAGSIIAGETSIQGAVRELFEETGIKVLPDDLFLLTTINRNVKHCFVDVYITKKDIPLSELVFQKGETCDAKWITFDEWEDLLHNREVVFAVKDNFGPFSQKVYDYMRSNLYN